jgi:PBP1b-binding outer membrane lipoprotein LpoB
MKKASILIFLLATVMLVNSCSKKEDPVVPPTTPAPAKLTVMIREALSTGEVIPQANAKFQLYKTEADWMAKTNAVADVTVDGNGDYTFENLEAINYLFHAQSADGTKTNDKTGNQTGVLKSNETKQLTVLVK